MNIPLLSNLGEKYRKFDAFLLPYTAHVTYNFAKVSRVKKCYHLKRIIRYLVVNIIYLSILISLRALSVLFRSIAINNISPFW